MADNKNIMNRQVSCRDFLKAFSGVLAMLSFGGLFALTDTKTVVKTNTETNTKVVKEYITSGYGGSSYGG